MTTGEHFTVQFYAWEYRGRGWFLADEPIQLEAPYIPFIRHLPQGGYIDDGRRPTIISSLIEFLKGKKQPESNEIQLLDYNTLEPYAYEEEPSFTGLQVKLPKERIITTEMMKALLIMLSSAESMLSFEIIGNAKEIIVQFVCNPNFANTITSHINAFFPKVVVRRSDEFVEHIIRPRMPTAVVDFGLRDEFYRPLATSSNFKIDPLNSFIGVLESLQGEEHGGMQILFAGTVNGWHNSIQRSVTMRDGSSFFIDAPESPKLAIEKTHSPMFAVTMRAFGQGADYDESESVCGRIAHTIRRASMSPHNMLIPLPTEEYSFEQRLEDIYLRQSRRLGMLLNIDELVHLLHFPSEQIQARKLYGKGRKTKELPASAKGHDFILGTNVHHDKEQTVTVNSTQRLKHTHIIGATGTGKSTLLLSMIVQDMEQGNGVAVLDPHGDLIEAIIGYIPKQRMKDVIIVDPADSDHPIGFNILQAHSEIEKEVLSSDLVATFKRNSTSWGDQMNSVFANAVIAFLESSTGGTLTDLRRFLIEKEYRQSFLQTVSDPSIKYYWLKEYPLLKTTSVGPILTRLDTFLRPRLIRNMVCQQKGLDFGNMFDTQKILLIKLSQGLIGIENSYLLGTFMVSKIHQAALAQQAIEMRKDFFFYIDEFQHFITPSMADILSGTRKYHLGLILGHEYMEQLKKGDSEITGSVVGNAYTRICFRVGEDDAKKLAHGFSYFEAQDLQNLETGEAIARIEKSDHDFSLNTIPVLPSSQAKETKQEIIAYSRATYGTPRAVVEELIAKSMKIDIEQEKPASHYPKNKSEKEKPSEKKDDTPKNANKPSIIAPHSIPTEAANEELKEQIIQRKVQTQHRYLQTLIKKMAESKGYKATIEAVTPDGNGKVDVLLERDNETIACEVSVTTDVPWELHNIQKCLNAGYGVVISCVPDHQMRALLQNKVQEYFSDANVKVYDPDALFGYLDSVSIEATPQTKETLYKGYRVKVSYDAATHKDHQRKQAIITKIIAQSQQKRDKK